MDFVIVLSLRQILLYLEFSFFFIKSQLEKESPDSAMELTNAIVFLAQFSIMERLAVHLWGIARINEIRKCFYVPGTLWIR